MFSDFISPELKAALLKEAVPVVGVPSLRSTPGGSVTESAEAMRLLQRLLTDVKASLKEVHAARARDRRFLDQRTKAAADFNKRHGTVYTSPEYQTVIGMKDPEGRVVIGPLFDNYVKPHGSPVAPLPPYMQGPHVTLFGPPDTAKLAINAVNCLHRQLPNEPPIVADLVSRSKYDPKWGADDEDSKTPLRADLGSACENLSGCFDGSLATTDKGKSYAIVEDRQALPIKRIPGLALPCTFMFDEDDDPVPLHLYDFAMHVACNWHDPKRMNFYIPKLENEEEAAYCRTFIRCAEELLREAHPEYSLGTIRVIIVMENPRAIFRTHEIMDALHPYFAGASLGWHDYLASAARVFKEDPNYRIPVKADPDIVIKYIKASHRLLADVVGPRGGIKIGGMYGVLPVATDVSSPGFQVVLKGYFRDVCTQMKRGLDGFWVAHPDFVRIGVAIVEAWKARVQGDSSQLETLVRAMLREPKDQDDVLDFVNGPDIAGLDLDDAMYARSLIVADLPVSDVMANHHPDEIRYNVFQTLQYLADWLSGRGCVALPAQIGGHPVRVMDDLATCERSRWEVWCEVYHGRFSVQDLLQIAHEEMGFIRKDLSDGKKIVQVKYTQTTEKWYPVAFNLMIRMMTHPEPVEFATELLLTFTIPAVRDAADPWQAATRVDPVKYGSRFGRGKL